MPEREKVIKGLNDIGGFIAERIGFEQARNFLRTIDDAIAILTEREAVVRCKDCKFHIKPMEEDNVGDCLIKQGYFPVTDNWYCADAERREDDE